MKVLLASLAFLTLLAANTYAAPVDYVKQIQPLLAKNCIGCHNAQKAKGKVRLDSIDAAIKNDVIVPGNSKTSALFQCLTGDGASQMPPRGPALNKDQITLIKNWIDQGAKAPAVGANNGKPMVANNKPAVGNNPLRRGRGREREREKREMEREKQKREKEKDD